MGHLRIVIPKLETAHFNTFKDSAFNENGVARWFVNGEPCQLWLAQDDPGSCYGHPANW